MSNNRSPIDWLDGIDEVTSARQWGTLLGASILTAIICVVCIATGLVWPWIWVAGLLAAGVSAVVFLVALVKRWPPSTRRGRRWSQRRLLLSGAVSAVLALGAPAIGAFFPFDGFARSITAPLGALGLIGAFSFVGAGVWARPETNSDSDAGSTSSGRQA